MHDLLLRLGMAVDLRLKNCQRCLESSNGDLLDDEIVNGAPVNRIRDCDGEKYTDHDRNDIGQCPSQLRTEVVSRASSARRARLPQT